MLYENIALKLQISPQELAKNSLQLYLQRQLYSIEAQMLDLSRKYGVKTVTEFDRMALTGRIHEAEAFEDLFEFDHLEAERDMLTTLLAEVA